KNDISQKHGTLSEIKDIEKKIDDGSASTSDREKKIKLLQDIDKFDNLEALDLIQKAHIKWDIEVWISEPSLIKEVFLNYYKEKFRAHDSHVVFSPMTPSSTLFPLDSEFLESQISFDEVKNAIWDCRSNKAPGPDGFYFTFIKKYWDLMKTDIFEFVNSFFVTGSLPQGANSSFFTIIPKISNPISIKDIRPISLIGNHYKIIAKILANRLSKVTDKVVSKEQSAFISGRQILDSPLIISEIIQCWKYLDFVLHSLNFGSKWRSWIRACLHSSKASILINGNPTCEFSIKRGLRQGYPLSSFLFILVMEGLQCAMSNAVVHIFYLASGLRINIHKSNIYGIRVSNDEISSLVSRTGCATGFFPFSYLGLLIGANMNLTSSWSVLIDRFQKRLSSWKANLLSIRGRLTLIKAVLGFFGAVLKILRIWRGLNGLKFSLPLIKEA
ncbi:putative RNA-directed DNA polymerase, eukaryota, reverse transcriptase zinc-binding domain protein, partial [Tanacetum coccineum]